MRVCGIADSEYRALIDYLKLFSVEAGPFFVIYVRRLAS